MIQEFPESGGFRSGEDVLSAKGRVWLLNYGVDEVADIDGVVTDSKGRGRGRNRLQPNVFARGLLIIFSTVSLLFVAMEVRGKQSNIPASWAQTLDNALTPPRMRPIRTSSLQAEPSLS